MVPTPGHTAGSISLIMRRAGRPTLARVGDLTFDVDLLERASVPAAGDRRLLRRATAMLSHLCETHPGLILLPTHNPGAGAALAEAFREPQ